MEKVIMTLEPFWTNKSSLVSFFIRNKPLPVTLIRFSGVVGSGMLLKSKPSHPSSTVNITL